MSCSSSSSRSLPSYSRSSRVCCRRVSCPWCQPRTPCRVEARGGAVDRRAAAPTALWSVGESRRWRCCRTVSRNQVRQRKKKKLTIRLIWRASVRRRRRRRGSQYLCECRGYGWMSVKQNVKRKKKNLLAVENSATRLDGDSWVAVRDAMASASLPKVVVNGDDVSNPVVVPASRSSFLVKGNERGGRGRGRGSCWKWECSNSNGTVKWHVNFHTPQISSARALFFSKSILYWRLTHN